MIVRPERPDDYDAIGRVVGDAFVDEPAVVDLVTALRGSPAYHPEFALVADDSGDVVGHVMLTDVRIGDGRALQLSPLAVRPDRQRQGIGSLLVRAAIAAAADAGEALVCLEGSPAYYSRFGFVRGTELGVERPSERVPEPAFQAIALASEYPRGRVVYPRAFAIVE